MNKSPYLVIPLLLAGAVFVIYYSARHGATGSLVAAPTPEGEQSQQAAPPPGLAPTAGAPQDLVRLAWFYKPPDEGQLDLVARHFDFYILTYKDEAARDQLKTMGVDERFAQYLLFLIIEDPGDCEEDPHGNQIAFKEGDFCQISEQYPDWFLLDQNGERIPSGRDTFHMDPGSEGYRQFFLERVRELQDSYGWDDLFLDNVEASLVKMTADGRTVPKYPDEASYQQAVAGFLDYLHLNYFEPRGKKIYGNIISLREGDPVWDAYLRSMDGAMIESFATDWSDGYRDEEEWLRQMDEVDRAQAMGKSLILVAQGGRDDLELQAFAFASYLLVADGNTVFRYADADHYREVWLYDNYDLELGQPLGPRYQDGGGWRRDFTRGTVYVHPDDERAEIIVNP